MKFVIVLLLLTLSSFAAQADVVVTYSPQGVEQEQNQNHQLYKQLELQGRLDFAVFERAVGEYQAQQVKNPHLTIIDYTKSSTEKRLFVIDMAQEQLVFNTHVAHGQNSGLEYATEFSNRPSSHQTSLGVFITAETYQGGNGYSLRLDGMDPGMNDNARRRLIVMHGARYADNNYLQRKGYLGRSWGCPAVPRKYARPIIDTIKGGSVIYAYG